jgi:hypothetical protein
MTLWYLAARGDTILPRSLQLKGNSDPGAYRKGAFARLFGFAGTAAFQSVCLVSHITLMAEAKRTAAHGQTSRILQCRGGATGSLCEVAVAKVLLAGEVITTIQFRYNR